MRPFAIGLAAALALGALVPAAVISAPKESKDKPKVDAKAREAGMKDAPAIMQSLNAGCTVTDARLIGLDKKTATGYYEVACQDSIGFALIAKKDTPAQAFTCLESNAPAADGKPSALACILPGNENPKAGLKPFVAKAGVACDIENARAIGSGAKNSYFEIACKGGTGYVMQTTNPASAAGDVLANSCLLYEEGANVSCKLTDKAAQLAIVDTLTAASGKTCQVKDKRYVLSTKTDNYFEVACADGKGYMLQQTAAGGALARTIDCAQAGFVGGGCTLTDSVAAQTEQAGLYTKLSTKGGFDCQVEKYGMLPSPDPKKEIVELKCKNRPDGAIAIFSTGPAVIYDCLFAELNGYRCSFSKQDSMFPRLSADLKAYGKGSCEVSGVRLVGRNDNEGYFEVACSDGLPGWVMSYPVNTPNPKSKEILACSQAKGIGGGCKLPTNASKKS
ncbi:hypothetical protein [Caulobacter henricii]|uniref:Uncharacterized protein n=1 Tax=Caulobacter henricii TaxID=69395 RepID=A0A0P0NVZ9_9CAUL|nr:hypothetical protein [Caulobacter henricii]ALL12169.1 hypothetical protein AQ619_01650 [Caulobacter henricii]